MRALSGAPAPASSVPAALLFGAILVVTALTARSLVPARVTTVSVAAGLAGGAALVVVSFAGVTAVTVGLRAATSTLAWWVPLVALVAAAEELVLRGALFSAVSDDHGDAVAVVVTAVLFAVIHLPLYGLGAMPIDLAVGVVLGCLRVVGGGVTAPLIAHVVADVATAWLP